MDKSWKKPKLIVLAKGRPAERVLGICKNGTGGGPVTNYNPCDWWFGDPANQVCQVCTLEHHS